MLLEQEDRLGDDFLEEQEQQIIYRSERSHFRNDILSIDRKRSKQNHLGTGHTGCRANFITFVGMTDALSYSAE